MAFSNFTFLYRSNFQTEMNTNAPLELPVIPDFDISFQFCPKRVVFRTACLHVTRVMEVCNWIVARAHAKCLTISFLLLTVHTNSIIKCKLVGKLTSTSTQLQYFIYLKKKGNCKFQGITFINNENSSKLVHACYCSWLQKILLLNI